MSYHSIRILREKYNELLEKKEKSNDPKEIEELDEILDDILWTNDSLIQEYYEEYDESPFDDEEE